MIQTNDFIAQAQELLKKEHSSEVDSRSAISRAYYSLFHESLNFLCDNYKNLLLKTITSYLDPLEKYQLLSVVNSGKSDYESISKIHVPFHRVIPDTIYLINKKLSWKYTKYRKKRQKADYEITTTVFGSDAVIIVKQIDELIKLIKRL
jgi:uncharacterized protein (UPF0332 family)